MVTLGELEKENEKLRSKLNMMEISFEQINNSRNDLIRQLNEQEMVNKKLLNQIEQLQKKFREKRW